VNAVAGTELVFNYNTGEISKFYYAGVEKGATATSYSASSGAIFNLGSSNSNYSGSFASANVAGQRLGITTSYSVSDFNNPTITNGPSVISITAGAGMSPVTVSGAKTIYTPAVPAGNLVSDPHPFATPIDYLMFAVRSPCR
jgi:hypothetical protein